MTLTLILAHIGAVIVKVVLLLTGHRLIQRRHGSERSVATKGHTIHWARWYDPVVALLSLGRANKMRQSVIELAQIQSGERVLDVGCGTGHLTKLVAERVGANGTVIGVDPAAEMIASAQQNHPALDFRIAAVEQLPFEDGS